MKHFRIWLLLSITLLPLYNVIGQQNKNITTDESNLKHDSRKHKRDSLRKTLKGKHFSLKANWMWAKLSTSVLFERPGQGILAIKLSMEEDFRLPDSKSLVSINGLYRITPKSGLFGEYYGLSRQRTIRSEKDIIFKGDTIPAGTESSYYFNTQVASIGYMFTIFEDPKFFFGIYFNAYIMKLGVGVESKIFGVKADANLLAPLPDVGLMFSYKINSWMFIDIVGGTFYVKAGEFRGWLNNFTGMLAFKPTKWLGISIGYQSFNVHVIFLEDEYKATIDYSFRGPAAGLSFTF